MHMLLIPLLITTSTPRSTSSCTPALREWPASGEASSQRLAALANRVCVAKVAAMRSFYLEHANATGQPCVNAQGRAWLANCSEVVDPLTDWRNYAEHPYAFNGQKTLGRLMANLKRQFPSLRSFIDIGANIGHFTEEIVGRWGDASTASPSAASPLHVVSIEPFGPNFGVLMRARSTLLHSVPFGSLNLSLVRAAVSGVPGRARFKGLGEWGRLSSLYASHKEGRGRREETVRVTTVDELVAQHHLLAPTGGLDVLKIDTEGAEMSVLRGAQATLPCTKIVLWECGHFRDGGTMRSAVDLLDEAGFDTLLLSNRFPLLISRGYWDPVYDAKGFRNCASFSRGLVDVRDFRSILRRYPRYAAPIATSVFPRGYRDDPPHALFDPLAEC